MQGVVPPLGQDPMPALVEHQLAPGTHPGISEWKNQDVKQLRQCQTTLFTAQTLTRARKEMLTHTAFTCCLPAPGGGLWDVAVHAALIHHLGALRKSFGAGV